MAASTGNQPAQNIHQRIEELKKVCQGLDESTASRAPAGLWSPKEILFHLWGPEESGNLAILQAILDRDAPRIVLPHILRGECKREGKEERDDSTN